MEIKEWLHNKGNYTDGLKLYAAHPKHKPLLLRNLQRKESTANYSKLKHELFKINVEADEIVVPTKVIVNEKVLPAPLEVFNGLKIVDLPTELHPLYIRQKTDFALACSLKIQLNELPAHHTAKALAFCEKIERLFDRIAQAWEVFDYYKATKEVLTLKEADFSNLSAAQLVQRLRSKRPLLTRAKQRLQLLKAKQQEVELLAAKKIIARKIKKTKAIVLQHKKDIQQLEFLINEQD